MAALLFVTLDVFTERRFGGNPLAVFPDARGLSDADMQALAREFNLSETTFVLPPDDPAHTARVRIFNPSHEMPFAGHPNIGTAAVLAWQDPDVVRNLLLFEEQAGLVELRIERDASGAAIGAAVSAPQPLRVLGELAPALIAACVGLQPDEILSAAHPPLLACTGNPLVFAEVSTASLRRAEPDASAFRRALAAVPALAGRFGLYLHASEGEHIRARMFSPLDGTGEDPATGSAATTLAALLLSRTGAARLQAEIIQGIEMGRPSLLHATAWRADDGVRASVGGRCVRMLSGEVNLEG